MNMNIKPLYVMVTVVGVCIGGMFFSGSLTGQETTEENVVKKRLVILTGDDLTHACGTHEFEAGGVIIKSSIAKSVLSDLVEVTHVHNWPEDASVFNDADMVLHYYKGNQFHLLNKNTAVIDALAQKGVGQMFIHYACDPDKALDEQFKTWTGGVYKDRWSGNPHWSLKSQLEKHPINQGVNEYTMNDEWYMKIDFETLPVRGYEKFEPGKVHSVMSGENVDEKPHKKYTKAVKDNDGSATVVFWAKESDNGSRGITVTGGHNHTAWSNDEFRKQVLNSVAWGLKLDVPENGVDSPAITLEQINENLDTRKPRQKKLVLPEFK